MKRAHLLLTALAALLLPLSTFAGTPTVSGLTARQRYPWNGLVDISFTLSESGYISVAATNTATGATVPVRTLRDKVGNAVEYTKFAPGEVSLVWDAGTDVPDALIEILALSVVGVSNKVQLWEGGPYWARENIGAEEPHEYGFYFWWGDTVGYRREGSAWVASDGSSQNFSFGSGNTPTYGKSNATLQSEGWITADGGLAPEHGAAHVRWGGSWRMPREAELSALNNNCDWTWTTINGVRGYTVRGRGDYSGASIFLPAAGYVNGTSLFNVASDAADWSSVPDENYIYDAWYLDFSVHYHRTCSLPSRSFGRSVRPVQGLAQ